MACSLQKLFAVEEEFEDEDFLSAVEDTENQFAGSHPVNSGCLRPVSSWPRDSVQAQSAGQLLSCPTAPSETLGQPAHGLHLPASSMPRTARGPPSTKTAPLRPISTSNNPARAILTELPQEPIKPPSIVCHPLLTFESQQQHSGKNLEEIMVSTPQTPTHGALAKFQTEIVTSSQASAEEDFGRGPWMTMKSALGLDERDPTCFLSTYSIVMVLRKAALKQLPRNKVPNMAVMIKSLTRSTMDASAVFKDPTGEMQGTVHRLLLETRLNELKPGSVLLLKQIGVFSPSLRNHYLNVTPNNLVHIYIPDCGDGNMPQPPQLFPKDPGNLHGSLQFDDTVKPGKDIRTAQNTETGAFPKEELTETDDLDGLLSELPEDFFCGTSTWDCAEAGHPP
ncbi:homologous recombination OB-fold protein isoform X4 [Erinaceus europaeus]|uniref:Homologous recombination OB-fold protein isoform X4 n=1 Tax=Erinaceus europaeus TaxID=9365 RepID=A0ABM3YE81_ERIEU|nr:homologous recombination OB-fold protein isoform X4 [Erinaceus europaeus]